MCESHETRAPKPHAKVELADVFRAYMDELSGLTKVQRKAVAAILNCRTIGLGGHRYECEVCGYEEFRYNSCLNRHCPKCQALNQARWLEKQRKLLLPVEYHHVVFTVSDTLHALFLANPRKAYQLLFRAVSETLKEVALNPEHLGAEIGFIAVLHTWTQTLLFHPHIHCLVPGGGLAPEGEQWIGCKPGFFLPVRVLSVVFRGKLLSLFEEALKQGKLKGEAEEVREALEQAARKDWRVYCKPPVAGAEQTLEYLGRYTYRLAISNARLMSMDGDGITFRYKDRADGNQTKLLTLTGPEFLRRFLLHVLPDGFIRIRYYGLLANTNRGTKLEKCRTLLGVEAGQDPAAAESWQELLKRLTGRDVTLCPKCKDGHLVKREKLMRAYTEICPGPTSFP